MLRKLCSSPSYSDVFDDTSGPHAGWDQIQADSLAEFSEAASAAVVAMTPDGSTDLTAMSHALLERPSQIFALLRLAADLYVARAALLRLRRMVGPLFGHPVEDY